MPSYGTTNTVKAMKEFKVLMQTKTTTCLSSKFVKMLAHDSQCIYSLMVKLKMHVTTCTLNKHNYMYGKLQMSYVHSFYIWLPRFYFAPVFEVLKHDAKLQETLCLHQKDYKQTVVIITVYLFTIALFSTTMDGLTSNVSQSKV